MNCLEKLICIVAVMLFLSSASYAYAGTIGDPPGTPGKWFKGEEPVQKDESKPPLVFVHGINSSSSTWSDRNDMAKQAVLNGYESAFIDLHPDQDMKKNGKLLAEKLKEIYDAFGRKLIVIGHSKGGSIHSPHWCISKHIPMWKRSLLSALLITGHRLRI